MHIQYNQLIFPEDKQIQKNLNDFSVELENQFATTLTQYPSSAAQFFGRESEMNQIIEKVHPKTCICISGAGGMGKSELVNQLVSELSTTQLLEERFPDGVIYYDFIHNLNARLHGAYYWEY